MDRIVKPSRLKDFIKFLKSVFTAQFIRELIKIAVTIIW
jgi:hypothetical protein